MFIVCGGVPHLRKHRQGSVAHLAYCLLSIALLPIVYCPPIPFLPWSELTCVIPTSSSARPANDL
jgi:hypothetical protein